MKRLDSSNYLAVPLLSVAILSVLSLFNWKELTGNRLANFNLVGDLVVETVEESTSDFIDPLLAAALDEVTSDEELPVQEFRSESTGETDAGGTLNEHQDFEIQEHVPVVKIDGIQPIEDFTADGSGLGHFAAALATSGERIVRIGVIGDSYIEGDIFTQDIRRLLQHEYGGGGVGYMSMHSDFPGFRRSINQSDNGWKVVDMRTASKDSIRTLAGEYCETSGTAVATFKASKKGNGAWNCSKVLFISPTAGGKINIKTSSGTQSFDVECSGRVQSVAVDEETSQLTVSTSINGLKVLGAWLDNSDGVAVDCMSLRGNSGVTHRSVNRNISRQMAENIDYDLLVIEFGMNVVSDAQSDYTSYSTVMSQVVKRLKSCYPDADILLMGVGDRGIKDGTAIKSMPNVSALVKAQRECARREGILFWDTREAMGGDGSIVQWRENVLVNSDYVHLNHNGGGELAERLVKALKLKLSQ